MGGMNGAAAIIIITGTITTGITTIATTAMVTMAIAAMATDCPDDGADGPGRPG
ncbi:exported protein of unknown function [Cupriavidus taiwanensis]|nr:exported protein of unknown function [Cupriavidus taiwanensis]